MHKPPYNTYYGVTKDGSGAISYQPRFIESGSWDSIKTPNFKTMKPSERPNNPFSASTNIEVRTPGVISWYVAPTTYAVTGIIQDFMSGDSFPLPTFNLDSQLKAYNRSLDDIKNQKINVVQAFAERRQAVDMITKNVNRLASAAMAIRRGNLKHASDLFKSKNSHKTKVRNFKEEIKPSPQNLSSWWLEFRYGWRPLVDDIFGACQVIADSYHVTKPVFSSVYDKQQAQKFGYKLFDASGQGGIELLDVLYKEKTTVKIAFIESSPVIQQMSSLGFTNPTLLAWELLPYSFVVDWFVPVGGYLSNLDATVGLSFRSGTSTTKKRLYGQSWIQPVSLPTRTLTHGGRTFIQESKVRSVLSEFPSPTLLVDPYIDTKRLLSGIALLTQAFKR